MNNKKGLFIFALGAVLLTTLPACVNKKQQKKAAVAQQGARNTRSKELIQENLS